MQPGQEVTDDWSGVNLPLFDCQQHPGETVLGEAIAFFKLGSICQ
jgi:hypothetical protein